MVKESIYVPIEFVGSSKTPSGKAVPTVGSDAPLYYGSGGGFVPANKRAEEEDARKSAELKAKQEIEKRQAEEQIKKEREQAYFEKQKQYREAAARTKTPKERYELLQEFYGQIGQLQFKEGLQRVEAGITTGFKQRTDTGEVTITKSLAVPLLKVYEGKPITERETQKLESRGLIEVERQEQTETREGFVSTVEAVKTPAGFLDRQLKKLSDLRQTSTSPIKSFIAGAGTSIVFTAAGVKALATEPLSVIKAIPSAIKNLPQTGAKIGVIIRDEPAYATGFIGAEIGQYYLPKAITKGSDVIRTFGKTELSAKEIIAPEYYKGQTFPSIRKGETAGELLGEFKPFMKGQKPMGFTASPKPIPSSTIVLKGASEFPGLYQAPKVSPYFLRVTSEKKLIGLSPFDTLRPSISAVTPSKFELLKGVKASQIKLSSYKIARKTFSRAELGKSYIPFIKTEKEAIIPAGTRLTATGSKYYIKFEGRSIPIKEFKVSSSKSATASLTTKDIMKISSSGRIGTRGTISSYDIARSVSKYTMLGKGYGQSIPIKRITSKARITYKAPKSSYSIPMKPYPYTSQKDIPSRIRTPPTYPPTYQAPIPVTTKKYYTPQTQETKLKKKESFGVKRSDLGISQGFTARILEIKPQTISTKDIGKYARSPRFALGIRAIKIK